MPAAPPTVAASPHKVCPTCGQRAVMSMALCGRCGYRYPGFGPAAGGTTRPSVHARELAGRPGTVQKKSNWAAFAVLGLLFVVGLVVTVSAVRSRRVHGQAGGSALMVVPSSGVGGSGMATAVDSGQIEARLASAHATVGGELEVSLAWNTLTDLDIEVRAPSGEVVNALNARGACGGVQDVDANPTLLTPEGEMRYHSGRAPGAQNVMQLPDFMVDLDKRFGSSGLDLGGMGGLSGLLGGDGSRPATSFTHSPVEHIYFAHADKGTYTVYVSVFSWREPTRNPLPYTVLVKSNGRVANSVSGGAGPVNFCSDGAGPVEVCKFEVK